MKKVLIVDDTKNIRNLLTTCLEIEGHQVVSAVNGGQALNLLKTEVFDLVFLDIKLPEISGTEVLRRIRESGDSVPVIIMTAFATVKNAVECTKLGAVAYLQKPFTAEKVRQVLQENAERLEKETGIDRLGLETIKQLIKDGQLSEAHRRLKHVLSIDPTCGEIYLLLARVYEEQKNPEEAGRFRRIAEQFDIKS
jgi:two-component system, OmpR family, response regulator